MSRLSTLPPPGRLGLVVIGRNEGERLRICLASRPDSAPCVYVDSGSSDDSLAIAAAAGAEIVDLDLSVPFTAARARNAGATRLLEVHPGIQFLFFVDGDCEVIRSWPDKAIEFLDGHADVVAVCGRRRERYPDTSIFNLLCDMEWDTPVGETRAVGGDAVFRAGAFQAVGGYRAELIAGEEPELCVRLRAAGGRIWRLPEEMTLHDAAIKRWGQWWARNVRSGHAYAEGAALHGHGAERHFVSQTARALFWGAALPAAIALAAAFWVPAIFLALVYPIQFLRVAWRLRAAGSPAPWLQSALYLLGRFPEAQGAIKYRFGQFLGRRSSLIEYK